MKIIVRDYLFSPTLLYTLVEYFTQPFVAARVHQFSLWPSITELDQWYERKFVTIFVDRWMWLTVSVLVLCLNVAMSSQEDIESDRVAQMVCVFTFI